MGFKKTLLIAFAILAGIMLIAGIVWLIKDMLIGGVIFTILGLIVIIGCLKEYTITEFEQTLK